MDIENARWGTAYPAMACLMLLAISLGLATGQALAATPVAAKVQFAVGNVTATTSDGVVRRLKKGDYVYSGDTIESRASGSAQLIFKDRSRMAVRANTRFQVEDYRYAQNDESGSRSIFRLFKGALRSVTGLIGAKNRQNVAIHTPVATIGVRGTDHEVVHLTPEFNRPEAPVDIGTYDRVYAGATSMKTLTGQVINLNLNDVGYVGGTPNRILAPVKIRALPKSIERMLMPKLPLASREPDTKREEKRSPANPNRGKTETQTREPGLIRQAVDRGKESLPLLDSRLANPAVMTGKVPAPSSLENTRVPVDSSRVSLPQTSTINTVNTLVPVLPDLKTSPAVAPRITPGLNTAPTVVPSLPGRTVSPTVPGTKLAAPPTTINVIR